MNRYRLSIASCVAIGGAVLLSGCVAVPGGPAYSGAVYSDSGYSYPAYPTYPAYSQPYYVDPGPTVFIGGTRYYDDRRNDRGYRGRPGDGPRPGYGPRPGHDGRPDHGAGPRPGGGPRPGVGQAPVGNPQLNRAIQGVTRGASRDPRAPENLPPGSTWP